MKTYIIKENYGDIKRITVEDDTIVSINDWVETHEGNVVKFCKPTLNCDEKLIAAFGNIKSVYLDDANIEEQTREYEKCATAEPTPFTTEWTTISTTS